MISQPLKNPKAILDKLGIDSLNAMQLEAQSAIHRHGEVILHSPTGTGKTLAFLLPILAHLEASQHEVQCLVLVPSRELAIQIEQVVRNMGTGFKTNAVYGGRAVAKDKDDLKHRPAILIGTPGRVADHIRRGTIDPATIRLLVLDEYDKSLEIGFEAEMAEICAALPALEKKVLTSATRDTDIPDFVGIHDPLILDHTDAGRSWLEVRIVESPTKDKLETLSALLAHLGEARGIVFCNFKDAIQRISDHLHAHGIAHGCFYGGTEQRDRERALIQFRNGSYRTLLATDLAARGIDVPAIDYIIHYHLPTREQEYTHRNGRTARMDQDGVAYILRGKGERLPEFIPRLRVEQVQPASPVDGPEWRTLVLSAGRKDNISKGDVVGFLTGQGQLLADQVGQIELTRDEVYVAIDPGAIERIIQDLDNQKIKGRKVRLTGL
ncbi:MAG TPA: DEAD/DEAH box helicase [Saprospiraceae bacterium]|nr:DEAD/DEAH box helicase [Saprospiraceae bacterium]HRW75935.1 DEAD/DEAH box helicase [Saprospiraceae bacterium]